MPTADGLGYDVIAFQSNRGSKDGGVHENMAPPVSVGSSGGGGQPPAVAFQPRVARNGRGGPSEVAYPLTAEAGKTGKGDSANCVIAFTEELNASEELVGPLSRGGEGGRKDGVAIPISTQNATRSVDADASTGMGVGEAGDPAYTVTESFSHAVQNQMQVRRLTPIECERLQGFQDNYTQIPWRGKPADQCPDGVRYKALGNSMAVPCMRWIGERIEMVEEILP